MKRRAAPSPTPDFRVLFEAAPGLYLVLTPSLTIVAASDAYLCATMTKREEILGRALFDVFPDNPDDPAATGVHNLRASLDRVRDSRVSDTMAVQKYDIRRPESEGGGFEERYWSPTNSPVLDLRGELAYIIHRVEDVTEFVRLKRLGSEREKLTDELRTRAEQMEAEVYLRAQEVAEANRQLRQANDELARLYEKTKELDRLKTEFFANVSHELRTPLALIIGPTEQLLTSNALDEHLRRQLGVVLRNARLLLRHVNDLLDVSKLEAGKMALHYVETDVVRLVRVTTAHFDSHAQERNVGLAVEAEGALVAEIDPEKLQRVLLNLLSNAFKFTPDGGRIRCAARLDESRARVRLEVADSGPGIAPEHRDVAFDRFRQLDGGPARRHGGTGLGLAIARDFVELHGGTISIGEAPEGGALITVLVPIKAPAEAPVVVAEDQRALAEAAQRALVDLDAPIEVTAAIPAPAGELGRPFVLVIEDNPAMNQFVRESLGNEYRTDFALNGKDGLRKALEHRPDLIVSDVMMPEMSGDVLVREIRARRELHATPLLLLTAKADDELRVRLLQEGANDYVMKPFSVEELRARVRNLVNAKLADERTRRLNAELKERQDRLERLAAQLETSNEELESFGYSVSHDLRAPLRAIDGFSQMLFEDHGTSLPPEGRRLLVTVREQAQRMGRLIDDLLAFSRLGRKELDVAPVDVAALAQIVVKELRQADAERQVEVVIGPLPPVRGDRALLLQVLTNLIGNAFKFTRQRLDARVEIASRSDGGETVYYVRDNGAGFDMRHADKLFGVFQRLHRDDEFEGTGVGLALVQRIVRRHGGRIWGEARVNEGATFSFTLQGEHAQ